jgi:hypothetical protein
MSESGVQYAIHHMSHQKVVADKKWGAIPLTAERVKRLLEVVQNKRSVYKNGRVYEEILIRWSNNDFSKADEDHNVIWKLQNGDVGRATGLLSSEEEQKFIEKHFKRNR